MDSKNGGINGPKPMVPKGTVRNVGGGLKITKAGNAKAKGGKY